MNIDFKGFPFGEASNEHSSVDLPERIERTVGPQNMFLPNGWLVFIYLILQTAGQNLLMAVHRDRPQQPPRFAQHSFLVARDVDAGLPETLEVLLGFADHDQLRAK